MRCNLPFLVALFFVAAPVLAIGKLHKDGVLDLDHFPPKIVKEKLVIEPKYPKN
jgi:hypothetical protein